MLGLKLILVSKRSPFDYLSCKKNDAMTCSFVHDHFSGLVQDCCNSSALAIDLMVSRIEDLMECLVMSVL